MDLLLKYEIKVCMMSIFITFQTERDTIEVIAYLKKEDAGKELELDHLRQEVKDLRVEATKEREALIAEYSHKIAQMEKELLDKEEEVCVCVCVLHC